VVGCPSTRFILEKEGLEGGEIPVKSLAEVGDGEAREGLCKFLRCCCGGGI